MEPVRCDRGARNRSTLDRSTLDGWIRRFLSEEQGQDLVEYAFLAAFIGIAGWAVIMSVPDAIGDTYESWVPADGSTGAPSLWDPPEPTAGGS